VQVGSNTEPDLIVMNIGPKGDTGATGNTGATGPAGPNSVTSATTSDGTANLSLSNVSTSTATVSGLLTAGHIHGNLAGTLYTHVRTGEAMSKGDPFYISGFHVGSSQPIVMKADASNAAKMPAVGVMDADYAANTSSANGIISGTLSSVDTDGYAVNSPIYVANGGGYSNTAGTIPQQIGITERANANTGAFIVTNSKVISFADVSDAQTGTADLILENLTATNIGSGTASIGSALIVGDGDSVKGRYDIFGNTSHFQWYSDSVLYGEREFVITTENLTSSGSWAYKYPAASGTFAVTASTTGVPDKLTDGTIAGTTIFNTTSYTYGTGAAAAHRTALELGDFSTVGNGSDVSVTGAVTLTSSAFGKMHVCTGTSADYTVTLPSPSGNTGRMIAFRMSASLTKFVTLSTPSGAIDGVSTRVMWAQETAILYCDGTNWTKVSGKSRPLMASGENGAGVTVSNATVTPITLATTINDASGAMIETVSSTKVIRIKRAGNYQISSLVTLERSGIFAGFETYNAPLINTLVASIASWATSPSFLSVIPSSFTGTTTYSHISLSGVRRFSLSDYIALGCYQNTGGTMVTRTPSVVRPNMSLIEIPEW
jgi:hypothetical protein